MSPLFCEKRGTLGVLIFNVPRFSQTGGTLKNSTPNVRRFSQTGGTLKNSPPNVPRFMKYPGKCPVLLLRVKPAKPGYNEVGCLKLQDELLLHWREHHPLTTLLVAPSQTTRPARPSESSFFGPICATRARRVVIVACCPPLLSARPLNVRAYISYMCCLWFGARGTDS